MDNPFRHYYRLHIVLILVLVGMGWIALPAAGTQYEGTVPSADEDLPGTYVRYIDLDKDDKVEWSWKSGRDLDFTITIPAENTTLVSRTGMVSQAGHINADRSSVYRFAWYNDDTGNSVRIDYTIHQVQTDAIVVGIAVIGIIVVIVISYIMWYRRRFLAQGRDHSRNNDDGEDDLSSELNAAMKRVAILGIIAALIAISVIAGIYLPLEGLEVEKGSELVIIIENTSPDGRTIWMTIEGSDDLVAKFDSIELAGGQTQKVLHLASPDWLSGEVTIGIDVRTTGSTSEKTWTPVPGQRDVVSFAID